MQVTPRNDVFHQDDEARRARADQTLWQTLGTLFRWRWFITGVTGAVAVAAVVITLLMPNWFIATATVLAPESGGGMSGMLMRSLPSAAASLLGGSGGDYVRYLAILNSRTVLEAAVDSFDLVRVYELEEERNPRQDALRQLQENVGFGLDEKLEYLSVSVADNSPGRAAEMANFFVRRLNEVNGRLSAQNAGNYRRFLERRYYEAEAAMDSVLDATRAFQERYGLYDLTAQTERFLEQAAILRTQVLEAEIQYEVAQDQYGSDNPTVQQLRRAAQAANAKYQAALAGREQLMPVPQREVPEVVRRYADLELERTIQATILEVLRPMFEQARLQEEQKVEAVQVLDYAVPPVKKAGPRRSIIVIVSTLSAFLLATVFVLLWTWWRRHHTAFAHRLREAADRRPEETPVSR